MTGLSRFIQLFSSIPTSGKPHCLAWDFGKVSHRLFLSLPCSVLCTCWPSCPETQFLPGHFLCSKPFKWFPSVCRSSSGVSSHNLRVPQAFFCSDKKPPKTPSRPGWPQGRNPSAQQLRDFESQHEAPGTSSSCNGPKAPRRIMLVKNGDPRIQQTVVLSHRNTRNLTAFLSKASDLLHFPVKQVYTTSGKKVGCWGMLFSLKSSLDLRSKYLDGMGSLFLTKRL